MDKELELIALVHKNEFLYNKNLRDFTHKKRKQQKWQEIAKALHLPVEHTKKKWRTLRDRFYRTQKAYQLKSNSGAVNVLSNYKYAKSLSFLNNYQLPKKKRFSLDSEENMNVISQSPDSNTYFYDEDTNAIQTDYNADDDDDDDGVEENKFDATEGANYVHNEEVTVEITRDDKTFEEIMLQTPKKTELTQSLQLCDAKMTKELSFCSNLAYQLRDAQLPIDVFAQFQMEVYTSFHRAIEAKKAQKYCD